MPLKKPSTPPNVMFVVYGVPVSLPQPWITQETMQVSNSIQQQDNPQYIPPINLSYATYTIGVNVPMVGALNLHVARFLKASFKSISVSLAAEKYQNIDDTQAIDPSSVGKINVAVTDNFNFDAPGYLAMLCGYFGANMHFMAGYLESFNTSYDPHTATERWSITFQEKIVTTLRKGPPAPTEKPPVDSSLVRNVPEKLIHI